jgi:predicted aldo/keto reductase-like oxidoreductase
MEGKIKRRKFGRTGLHVTELSFGAMNLRLLDTVGEAYKILNYVLDQGVNLIDTARGYNGENGEGVLVESEAFVGKAIRERTDLKEPIVVVTKGHGYNLEELDKELETSLSKLGIEGKGDLRIGSNSIKFVYLFHGINEERWDEMCKSKVLDKAVSLKEEGVFNYLGFSSHYQQVKEIREALDTDAFDVVELPYNIFNPELGRPGENNMIKYAFDKGAGIINMKAFGGNGMPGIFKTLKEYISTDYPTMLNFCLANPFISAVDAGAKYVEEFRADIDTVLAPRLSEAELWARVKEAEKVAPHMKGICRECMHCLEKFECPNGVDFPGVLAIYSRYMINDKLNRNTSDFRAMYGKLGDPVEECIECGECMPWCEYKLDIPVMLKQAQRTFTS